VLKLFELLFLALIPSPSPAPQETCWYIVFENCAAPVPCNEKTCIQTGSNLVPADMNLDGTIAPGEGYTEPIYKCKADATHGHTGTYENALSWGKEKKISQDSNGNPAPGSRTEKQNMIYCFKKKGCPINDCTEHTDVNDPTKTVFFCIDPSQSGVNYDEHINIYLEEACGVVVVGDGSIN